MVDRGELREPVRRILLVEDDAGDAFLVGELLAEVDQELALTVAETLPSALAQLEGADCVLLDLNLPGVAGLDGLRALLGVDPLAAVCVLTGLDDEHLGTDAVAAGAQDYLVKGKVDGQLLIRAIRYAVERRRAETSVLRLREEELVAAEAGRLERGLLPSPLLDGSSVRPWSFYRSGRTRAVLGGDFYDAVRDPTGTVHAIIGDVSGHGPDEAALGALLRVSWRALVMAGVAEERLLPELQRLLVTERHDPRLFTTACTLAIEGSTATVRLAGHPPPVALWSTPSLLSPPVRLPLGVLDDVEWPALPVALPPDWALLLYTDGLIEARDPASDEFLWTDGLLDLLIQERATPAAKLPARLVERAEGFNGGPLLDDVAILLLEGA
ncbi:MAG: SpoIIE family protein phosphatase [Pseudonocardiales bacterium]|nr:SpoIIE family protein phosphatase [Pseudonocardiales bacterium]